MAEYPPHADRSSRKTAQDFATFERSLFNSKIALEGGDKEIYQDATDAKQRPSKQIRKTGMEGNWQAGRDWIPKEPRNTGTKLRKSLDSIFPSLTPRHFVTFAFCHARPLLRISYGVVLPPLLRLHHLGEHTRPVVRVPLQNLGLISASLRPRLWGAGSEALARPSFYSRSP